MAETVDELTLEGRVNSSRVEFTTQAVVNPAPGQDRANH